MCNRNINADLTIKIMFYFCCVLKEKSLYLIINKFFCFKYFPVTSSHSQKTKINFMSSPSSEAKIS